MKKNPIVIISLIVVGVLLTACATQYKPEAGPSPARLRVIFMGASTGVAMARECTGSRKHYVARHSTGLKPIDSNPEQPSSIGMPPAGISSSMMSEHFLKPNQPISLSFAGTAPGRGTYFWQCEGTVAFNPEASKDYEVRFKFGDFERTCDIIIERLELLGAGSATPHRKASTHPLAQNERVASCRGD